MSKFLQIGVISHNLVEIKHLYWPEFLGIFFPQFICNLVFWKIKIWTSAWSRNLNFIEGSLVIWFRSQNYLSQNYLSQNYLSQNYLSQNYLCQNYLSQNYLSQNYLNSNYKSWNYMKCYWAIFALFIRVITCRDKGKKML